MTESARAGPLAAGRFGPRAAWWLAWSIAGLSVLVFAAAAGLSAYVRPMGTPASQDPAVAAVETMIAASFLAFPIVGALIASRRPRNAIGWICLVDGLLWTVLLLVPYYTAYGLWRPGSLPYPVTINALAGWMWVPTVGLPGIFLVLLFPDGRLPSRRWRPLALFAGAVMVLESVAIVFTPGRLVELGGMRNPFGLEGQTWITYAGYAILPLLPLCILAAAVSLVLRYRRSGGEVRQQIKWIAFAASVMGVTYLALMVGSAVDWFVFRADAKLGERSLPAAILENLAVLSFCGVPVAIGFAVLKYRLYDIEVIVNRTLVYGSLTVVLAAVYAGTVASLQYAFRGLTGEDSQLAVVASTLLIAALFSPLRRRTQSLIDRGFYRSKYDARRSLESLSLKLRDETDLNALGGDVMGVVRETMQPAHASLWLRPDGRARTGRPRVL